MVTFKPTCPGLAKIRHQRRQHALTGNQSGTEAGNTVYDLDAGTIRTGRSNGNRVNIDDRGINWYIETRRHKAT